MVHTRNVFQNAIVEFLGIDVHYQDRFAFLLKKRWIEKGMTPKEWHDKFKKEAYEQGVASCFERIPFESIFRYQDNCLRENAGQIADWIMRL